MKSHDPELGHKSLITVVCADIDFMLTASDFGDLAKVRAICS